MAGGEVKQVKEWFRSFGPLGIGGAFFTYQLAFGISLRYWPCISSPAFRIYVGPFKIWGYLSFKKELPQQ